MKRFGSATYGGKDDSLVDIELFGSSLTTSEPDLKGKTLWDLSASAQTQLIQIFNERYRDNESFTAALNSTYMLEDERPVPDYSEKDLRMVFTIRKLRDYTALHGTSLSGRYSPADRIEFLKFSLRVPEEYGLRFKSWNRYSTEYGELDIADISFSRSFEIEVDAEPGERSSFGTRRSLSRDEEQSLRSRYLVLNGSISDYKIEIEEEGTREIDLCGNVTADVRLGFPGFPERITIPVFSGPESGMVRGSATGESAAGIQVPVKLEFRRVMVPGLERVPDTIYALLDMEYVYRHVTRGWDTYQEWDDRVKYFRGKVSREIPVFTREDILPELFCIGTDLPERNEVKIAAPSGREQSLHFNSYGDAERFFDWLSVTLAGWPGEMSTGKPVAIGSGAIGRPQEGQVRPLMIGGYTLIFRGVALTGGRGFPEGNLRVLPVYY